MSFSHLGLSPELLRAIAEQGYTSPTPIQKQAIPVVLQGRDLLAAAQTGTGKTAGFTLPILQLLSERPLPKGERWLRVLVLTPTRELAAQVQESVRNYGKYLRYRSEAVFGGVSIVPQIERLRRGVDILVATPGRLLDHAGQGTVDLTGIDILVLDEADRMLDMGFIHDVRRIIGLLPRQRQNLLFSATFSEEIRNLAGNILRDPVQVEVASRNAAADTVAQRVYAVDKERKRELLSYLIGSQQWKQVLVFARTKHGADRLGRQLERDGISSAVLHGDKSQGARTRALAQFKAGGVEVLVATDIAARGLDIDQLPHVVNFELPNVPEDYVHRIGRTGRAGANGEAISLVSEDEIKQLRDIERLLKREIPASTQPGFEPTFSLNAKPRSAPKPAHSRPDSQRRNGPGAGGHAERKGAGARPARRRTGGNGRNA
jgi:ATP-dependent RNA helicase RhlE